MNFTNAIKYPFQNFAKVMSIVLAMTIAFAVFIAMIINSHDWTPLLTAMTNLDVSQSHTETLQPLSGTTITGFFGLLLVAIVSGFWLSGYSVEVISAVMREETWMPEVNLGQNIKDGAALFAASAAYWVLFVLLMVVMVTLTGLLGQIIDILGLLAALASFVIVVGAALVMGWAYFVGMARFAAEGDYRTAWQIRRNIRIAREYRGPGFTLLLYMIAISLLYGVVRQAVDGVFGGLLNANMLAGVTLSLIIYYLFNLMQHFSTQHLIAQYAWKIGLRSDHYNPDKDKVDAV